MSSQKGCKYIDQSEAFDRVMRDANKQGAYLFYHRDEKRYQVVREKQLQDDKPMAKENKKKLDQNFNDERIMYVGFYNKYVDMYRLLDDIKVAAEIAKKEAADEVEANLYKH